MRKIDYFIRWLAAGLVVLVLFCVSAPAHAEGIPQVIRILQVKGHARFSTDNKTWRSLKKGELLEPGAMIQTAFRSTVDLQLGDVNAAPASMVAPDGSLYTPEELKGNTIRVYENSVLEVGKLTAGNMASHEASETQLELRAGRIMGAVRKTPNPSRYEIEFSGGVAGVREGTYLLNSSGAVDVLYGTAFVAMESAGGSVPVKTVTANHQFDPATGVVAEIRVPLPAEPLDSHSAGGAAPGVTPPSSFQGQGMGGSWRKF